MCTFKFWSKFNRYTSPLLRFWPWTLVIAIFRKLVLVVAKVPAVGMNYVLASRCIVSNVPLSVLELQPSIIVLLEVCNMGPVAILQTNDLTS